MRISKTLAVSAAGLSMAAAAALPAAAGVSHHPASKGSFKSSISPNPVHSGQTLTLKGKGAKKNTAYTCVIVVIKGQSYGLAPGLTIVHSNKKGKVTCKKTFTSFSASVNGKTRHCPLTKADKKAHFKCGMAVSTADKKSNTISYFTAKK
jgi:hypothetical protein